MTSATKNSISRAQVEQLLRSMQRDQPRVYAGLVRRFTPKAQLSGIWDSISSIASNVVNSVTNFVNSQGAQSLMTAAQPFIQNKLEKDQLKMNLQRLQAGLPMQTYVPSSGAYPGSTLPPGLYEEKKPIPWGWIAGGAFGVGALLLMSRR